MPAIYQARDVTDASLLRDVLEDSGITAHVRGAHLQAGAGELPASGMVAVWVDDPDADAARAVVQRWERGDFALTEDAGDPAMDGASLEPPPPPRRTAPLFAFVVGAGLGALLVWATTHGPTEEGAIDHDGDGRIDERVFFSRQGVERVETDRNRDGRIDDVMHYANGMATNAESDDDFDGRFEAKLRFVRNVWVESEYDWDGNDLIDYRIEANAGVIAREQWLEPDGRVTKQVLHENGRARSVEIDRDGDGSFEIRQRLDRYAEPIPQ